MSHILVSSLEQQRDRVLFLLLAPVWEQRGCGEGEQTCSSRPGSKSCSKMQEGSLHHPKVLLHPSFGSLYSVFLTSKTVPKMPINITWTMLEPHCCSKPAHSENAPWKLIYIVGSRSARLPSREISSQLPALLLLSKLQVEVSKGRNPQVGLTTGLSLF